MAKYRVNMSEENIGSIIVEADDMDEACELATEAYTNGDVEWGKTDFQVEDIKEVKA